MKKNVIFVVALFFEIMLFSSFTENNCNSTPSAIELESESGIVFRGKQEFRNSKLNQEIYFYTNGTVKWFENDDLILSCYYTIDGTNLEFTDEYGNTACKGYISWNNTHSKPISITIKGTTFYNKN